MYNYIYDKFKKMDNKRNNLEKTTNYDIYISSKTSLFVFCMLFNQVTTSPNVEYKNDVS